MTSTDSDLGIVQSFFAAKERHDLDAVAGLLADDVVYRFPLPASGEQDYWFVYEGKEETLQYQRGVLDRFEQIRMTDVEYTVGTVGGRVFVTSRGDYRQGDGTAYKNVYVFRFVLRGGLIVSVDEYANPVTYAKLAGLPIG